MQPKSGRSGLENELVRRIEAEFSVQGTDPAMSGLAGDHVSDFLAENPQLLKVAASYFAVRDNSYNAFSDIANAVVINHDLAGSIMAIIPDASLGERQTLLRSLATAMQRDRSLQLGNDQIAVLVNMFKDEGDSDDMRMAVASVIVYGLRNNADTAMANAVIADIINSANKELTLSGGSSMST